MAACPVVARLAGGCSVNAIEAGTVIVVVAETAFATSVELRLYACDVAVMVTGFVGGSEEGAV
jgi:hypothetical protein